MGRTLAELLESVSARELALWEAEYSIEPWGEFRTDLAAARVTQAVAAANGSKRKLLDFLPKWEETEQDPADMRTETLAWIAKLKGLHVNHR